MSRYLRLLGLVIYLAVVPQEGALAAVIHPEQDDAEIMPYEPQVYPEEQISLIEAIRLTLEQSPDIFLKAHEAEEKKGLAQEATGQFDTTLKGSFNYELTHKPLLPSEQTKQHKARKQLEDKAAETEEEIAKHRTRIAEFEYARQILLAGGDLDSVTFTDTNDQVAWVTWVATYAAANAADKEMIKQYMLDWIAGNIAASNEAIVGDYENCPNPEELEVSEDDYDKYGLQCKLELLRKTREMLGDTPLAEKTYSGSLKVELSRQFRNGISLSPYFNISGQGTNYRDKTKRADYGGKGTTDSYNAAIGFKVLAPLGRGRGVDSTGAPERAADINYDAAVDRITHSASKSSLDTMLAYWSLVAAQKELAVHESILALNEEILALSKERIDADVMPRAELSRAQAQCAETQAKLEHGRRNLHESRIALAKTIGLKVEDVAHAPLAADDFPAPPTDETLSELDPIFLFETALLERDDYRASRLAEEAGKVLWDAATLDLKRKTDVELELWYTGLSEHSNVLKGMENALFHKWGGPSARLRVDFDWPYENNVQYGKLKQKQALYNKQHVSTEDLKRVIQANIVLIVSTIQEVAQQHKHFVDAGAYYQQTVETEREKLRLGTTTLIDVLTTIQNQFNTQLQVISTAKSYAELLAKLRFESGTLVTRKPDEKVITSTNVISLPISR